MNYILGEIKQLEGLNISQTCVLIIAISFVNKRWDRPNHILERSVTVL